MAELKDMQSSSEDTSKIDENLEEDEDVGEIDFPFDLSEWTVLDADDDEDAPSGDSFTSKTDDCESEGDHPSQVRETNRDNVTNATQDHSKRTDNSHSAVTGNTPKPTADNSSSSKSSVDPGKVPKPSKDPLSTSKPSANTPKSSTANSSKSTKTSGTTNTLKPKPHTNPTNASRTSTYSPNSSDVAKALKSSPVTVKATKSTPSPAGVPKLSTNAAKIPKSTSGNNSSPKSAAGKVSQDPTKKEDSMVKPTSKQSAKDGNAQSKASLSKASPSVAGKNSPIASSKQNPVSNTRQTRSSRVPNKEATPTEFRKGSVKASDASNDDGKSAGLPGSAKRQMDPARKASGDGSQTSKLSSSESAPSIPAKEATQAGKSASVKEGGCTNQTSMSSLRQSPTPTISAKPQVNKDSSATSAKKQISQPQSSVPGKNADVKKPVSISTAETDSQKMSTVCSQSKTPTTSSTTASSISSSASGVSASSNEITKTTAANSKISTSIQSNTKSSSTLSTLLSHRGPLSKTPFREGDNDSLKSSQGSKSSHGNMSTATKSKENLLDGKKDSDSNFSKDVDPKKKNSLQGLSKSIGKSDLFGGIAEAMEAGDFESGDIQVSDLDLIEVPVPVNEKKRPSPVKSSHDVGSPPKKRPAQGDAGDHGKKARYEEKTSDQDPKSLPSKLNDKTKPSQVEGADTLVSKEIKKRVVRRFHRTTQTVSKTFHSQWSQCSFGQGTSKSSPRKVNHSGVQCKIGEKFNDIKKLMDLNIIPVCENIKQEVFMAALAFDASTLHPDILKPGYQKFGIRIGPISHTDIERTLLKDSFIKKSVRYTLSFWDGSGVFDLFFNDEENFVGVLNQIRKIRIGQRYLCVTLVKKLKEADKGGLYNYSSWDHLKATLVLDQNFASTGYLAFYKTPIWSRPKVDEFVTLHCVPAGIPLSFLSLVIPDAITLFMQDSKLKTTISGRGVKLGLNRKNGTGKFLKLFTQILINDTPALMTKGVTDINDVPELKEPTKLITDMEKFHKEWQKERSFLRTISAKARDINENKKGSGGGTVESRNFSSRKDKLIGTRRSRDGSDLSDVSELSFKEESRLDKRTERRPVKKVEPRKSLSMAMGNKLLNRARTSLHQTNRRHNQESEDIDKRRIFPGKREFDRRPGPERRQEDPPFRRNLSLEHKQRGGPDNRHNDGLRTDRSPGVYRSREDNLGDKPFNGPVPKQGSWNQRDSDSVRRVTPDHLRRNRSGNRSLERDDQPRRNSERTQRSQERRDKEERYRSKESDHSFANSIDVVHVEQMASDLRRSSQDLRAVLDSKKPKLVRPSPPRHGSADRFRDGSLGRTVGRTSERRKRPLSRSPSSSGRKVMLGRRSLSPRNQSKRGRQDHDSRTVQANTRQLHGADSQEKSADGDNMTISKSLFVKLLTNALTSEEEAQGKGPTLNDVGLQNVNQAPGKATPRPRSQDTSSSRGREEKHEFNADNFEKFMPNNYNSRTRDSDIGNNDRNSSVFSSGLRDYNISKDSDRSRSFFPSGSREDSNSKNNNSSFFKSGPRDFNNSKDSNRSNSFFSSGPRDYNNDKSDRGSSNYFSPGPVKDNFAEDNIPKPIPPPVMPPIYSSNNNSNNALFQNKQFDSEGPGVSSSGPPSFSQGTWSVPNMQRPPPMPEKFQVPLPRSINSSQPPHMQGPPPINAQPPMNFQRPPMPVPPPFCPNPNIPPPQGMPPPMSNGSWNNQRPGFF